MKKKSLLIAGLLRNYQVRWPNGLPKVKELTAFTALQISCVRLA